MLTLHARIFVSLAALAIYAASLLALHLLPTGFSPLRDLVSLYAASRWGALYALALIAAGVCALGMAGAFGLMRAAAGDRAGRAGRAGPGAVSGGGGGVAAMNGRRTVAGA